jgi:hypothetical protein
MTTRKQPALAYGEYVSPDSRESVQVWQARLQLIEASKRVYPEFLDRLDRDVFPLFAKFADGGYDFESILWDREDPFEDIPGEL